ncbi:TasA family protein [Fredinandcohnia salidurans]|uniref:TasA family protein n=1 Tax=Fredinandcohnia salidurans TaxID=2595041 RepID=A0ABW4MUS4_9BACI
MRKILLILFLLLLNPIIVLAEDSIKHQAIDLSTNPGKVLFDLSNMKPGDSISRNLLISNNGKQDFKYILSNKFTSGDRVFYNQLDLIIENDNEMLYHGKLQKFEELAPRFLGSKQSEALKLFVQIPIELGNEFQNLSSDFQLKIYVEGTMGGVIPVDNKLPTTGSEMFNLLVTGAALFLAGFIIFTYLKRKKLDTKRP